MMLVDHREIVHSKEVLNMTDLFVFRLDRSGINLEVWTAFGITWTIEGNIWARRMKLSRQVCETQIAAPTVGNVDFNTWIWAKNINQFATARKKKQSTKGSTKIRPHYITYSIWLMQYHRNQTANDPCKHLLSQSHKHKSPPHSPSSTLLDVHAQFRFSLEWKSSEGNEVVYVRRQSSSTSTMGKNGQ